MSYQDIGQIIQIEGNQIAFSSRKVNAYLKRGWKLLNVLQLSDVNHDGGYSCAMFILGHPDPEAVHPEQIEYADSISRWHIEHPNGEQ